MLHAAGIATRRISWARPGSTQTMTIDPGLPLGIGAGFPLRPLDVGFDASWTSAMLMGVSLIGSPSLSPHGWPVRRIEAWAQTWSDRSSPLAGMAHCGYDFPLRCVS